LRYDFQTYLREQYGRWGSFGIDTPNPTADNLPGGMKFEANGPAFADNYKQAWGPRFGLAYQILPKTVLRIGAGISYARTPELGYLHNTMSNFVTKASPKRGEANSQLVDGAVSVTWPNFDPGAFPRLPSLSPPPVAIDRGRPRIFSGASEYSGKSCATWSWIYPISATAASGGRPDRSSMSTA
jgi:hypothetical protein